MLRRSNVLVVLTVLGSGTLAFIAACSSSSGGGSSGTSDGGGSSGTSGASGASGTSGTSGTSGVDSGGDSAAKVVNDCNTFVDRSASAASRTITWDFPVSTSPERCMTIKKGQDVIFNGDFTLHPLVTSGGDQPNPIAGFDATGKVSFAKAGTFGFVCGNHPGMTGAIKVLE